MLVSRRRISSYRPQEKDHPLPQETILFDDSLLYNIQYGDFSASRERALTAAEQVGLTAWADRTPGGFDARVGERGQALSGGERQRVAVARALLKRPALLLCDEATSALDPLIERSVVEVLNAASANVTTVLVAHKLQTVVDADLILVMSDGLLVEQGTHTSLLCQANSTYSRMWAEQASGFGGAARAGGEDRAPGSASRRATLKTCYTCYTFCPPVGRASDVGGSAAGMPQIASFRCALA